MDPDDEGPIPWPAIGDQLFRQNSNALDAFIATFHGERLYRMKKAFKLAADVLVEHSEDKIHERDNLVWPIVFCYRQYIELALKDMIARYGARVDPPIAPNWKGHDLIELWQSYKRLVYRSTVELDGTTIPEITVIEVCIKQFHQVDPNSYSFRYPTDTKGRQTAIPLQSIDLVKLHNVMQGLFTFLDSAESALDVRFDFSD